MIKAPMYIIHNVHRGFTVSTHKLYQKVVHDIQINVSYNYYEICFASHLESYLLSPSKCGAYWSNALESSSEPSLA